MIAILTIFDFDDTLIISDTAVIVNHADGTSSSMTSEEYAEYVPEDGDTFDYSNFDKYPVNPRKIKHTFDELDIALSRGDDIVILTARGNKDPVEEFLDDHGYSIEIKAVGSGNSLSKAKYVIDRLKTGDYDLVQVYEDNAENIRAIKAVVTESGIVFKSTRISSSHRNDILESLDKLNSF